MEKGCLQFLPHTLDSPAQTACKMQSFRRIGSRPVDLSVVRIFGETGSFQVALHHIILLRAQLYSQRNCQLFSVSKSTVAAMCFSYVRTNPSENRGDASLSFQVWGYSRVGAVLLS